MNTGKKHPLNQRSIYVGIVDDVVDRYHAGWPSGAVTESYFNVVLKRAALLERPLLINDGYLLFSDWGRKHLFNPDSLFRQLNREGQVVLFCRDNVDNFSEMPRLMKDQVGAYRALTESTHWAETEAEMKKLAKDAAFKWTSWHTADNRIGFEILIKSLAARPFTSLGFKRVTTEVFSSVVEGFAKARATMPHRGSRTQWEEVARGIAGADGPVFHELMHAGIETYHYNMALSATGEFSQPVDVATRFSPLYAGDHLRASASEYVFRAAIKFKHLERLKPAKFTGIMRDGKVQGAKNRYLVARETFEKTGSAADNALLLAEEKNYFESLQVAGLATILPPEGEVTVKSLEDTLSGLAYFAALYDPTRVSAVVLGAAVAVMKLSRATTRHLLAPMLYRPARIGSEALSKPIAALADAPAVTGSISLDGASAMKHVKAVAACPAISK